MKTTLLGANGMVKVILNQSFCIKNTDLSKSSINVLNRTRLAELPEITYVDVTVTDDSIE